MINKRKYYERENNKIFKEVMSNMEKDHISEYSAQCSYYTILSFIPFVILLITLIQYTNIEQQTLFDAISKIIPATMSGFVLDIVREVYSKSIGTISISIIFVLWSAGKGLYALMKGLYEVFKIDGKKKKICYLFKIDVTIANNYIYSYNCTRTNFLSIWR